MRDPEVLNHKRKSSNSSPRVPKALRRGGINWEPDFPEGEDEDSMLLHKQVICTELKKRCPDMEKIRKRMDVTYPERRKMINEKKLLIDLQKEYPALFLYEEVCVSIPSRL